MKMIMTKRRVIPAAIRIMIAIMIIISIKPLTVLPQFLKMILDNNSTTKSHEMTDVNVRC